MRPFFNRRPMDSLAKRDLSQKEHDQRVEAARARWAHRAKEFPILSVPVAGAAVGGALTSSIGIGKDLARLVRGTPNTEMGAMEGVQEGITRWSLGALRGGASAEAKAHAHWAGHLALEGARRMGAASAKEMYNAGRSLKSDYSIHEIDRLAATRAVKGPLWRGVHGVGARPFLSAKPGETVTMDPHTSWSSDPSVASFYSKHSYTGTGKSAAKRIAPTAAASARRGGKLDAQNAALGDEGSRQIDIAKEKRVRVHLRGADDFQGAKINQERVGHGDLHQETMLGRGTQIRIDRIKDSPAGRVVFATAVKQDAIAAYRRGLSRRLLSPAFMAGRLLGGAGIGAGLGLFVGGVAQDIADKKEEKRQASIEMTKRTPSLERAWPLNCLEPLAKDAAITDAANSNSAGLGATTSTPSYARSSPTGTDPAHYFADGNPGNVAAEDQAHGVQPATPAAPPGI